MVKVRQDKRTAYLVQTSRKEVAKGIIHVIFGMFLNVQKFKTPVRCKFGNKCVRKHTHTAKSPDGKKISATVAIHIPANDEREMKL